MTGPPPQKTTLLKLTKRWTPLKYHQTQFQLFHDPIRFKVAPAGRRSGKTELAKRKLVLSLFEQRKRGEYRLFACAPTRDQAKRIWWNDLKKLTPPAWMSSRPSETDLCIRTRWGGELWVIGLDKPDRMEGPSWDGGVVDEIASAKANIWEANIRPALSSVEREGWCWLIGVPDMAGPGQADYIKLYDKAAAKENGEWDLYTWPSG